MTAQVSRVRPFHPLLSAVLPVLLMYSGNVDQTSIESVLRPTVVILAASLILWALLALAFRSIPKAAVLASLCLVFFFSFGMFAHVVRVRVVLVAMALGLAITVYLLARTRSKLADLTGSLNVVTMCIAAVLAVNLTYQLIVRPADLSGQAPQAVSGQRLENLPDIYYIILDGYGRSDVLSSIYDIDNTEFLDQLRQRGFRVCERSQANYGQTLLSLPSSLNMCYLDELAEEVGIHSSDRRPLRAMLRNNEVVRLLRSHGYRFASFASGAGVTESLANVDHYFKPSAYLSAFEQALLSNTPLFVLIRRRLDSLRNTIMEPYESKRQVITYTLEHIADPRGRAQPVFVYAHIMCPHPPFVFDSGGGAVEPDRPYVFCDGSQFFERGGTRDEYLRGYTDHVAFISDRIVDAVDRILSASDERPIIVLQGDHGPRLNVDWRNLQGNDPKEYMSILNAYLLPAELEAKLYDEITPVNTFRLILNYLRVADCDLLEDRSYDSDWEHLYEFVDVTEKVRGQ